MDATEDKIYTNANVMTMKIIIEDKTDHYWVTFYIAGETDQFVGGVVAKDYRIDKHDVFMFGSDKECIAAFIASEVQFQ